MRIKAKFLRVVGMLYFCLSLNLQAQTVTKQFQDTRYNIKELCMVNSTTGWAAGGRHWDQSVKRYKGTMLFTSNAGDTWSRQTVGIDVNLWDVHFIDASHGWAVGDSGACVQTTNGGSDWIKVEIGTNLNFKSVYFTDSQNGWVVANEPVHYRFEHPDAWACKIWHTSDGGSTWLVQNLPAKAGLIHSIYFQTSLIGWAIGVKNVNVGVFVDTQCAAYFTTDGGQTWVEKFSPEYKLVFTDISFVDDNHGWLVGFASSSAENGGSVFRTVDGGATWSRIAEDHTLWQVEFVDTLKGYAVGTAYIAAWGPPVLRSLDGGITWKKVRMDKNELHGLYGLAVFEDKVLAVGDKGYVATAVDPWGEYQWPHGENLFTQKLISINYNFEDIYFANENKGWVVGQKITGPGEYGQVILNTDDGGETWSEQYYLSEEFGSPGFRLDAVQFVSETKGWAAGTPVLYGQKKSTGILFTDDGGTTWVQQGQGVAVGEIVDLFFFDDQAGWALTNANVPGGGNIQVLKTVDGGASWSLINTGQPGLITIGYGIKTGKIYFQDTDIGWILGAQCVLLKTTDGGATWSSVALPAKYLNTFSIAFNGSQNGIICGETIFATDDNGASWSKKHLIDRTFTDICFTGIDTGWMVGEYCNVYNTFDKGLTWNRVDHSATRAAMKSVMFIDDKNGWAAGRAGTIIKIDNSNTSVSGYVNTDKAPAGFELYQNYPNPFNPVTKIIYHLPQAMRVKIAVFDLLGRELQVLVNEVSSAGLHEIVFNAVGLETGVYLYKLQTDEYNVVKKMMVVK